MEFNQIYLCEVDSIFTHKHTHKIFFFQVLKIIHPYHEYILRDSLYELNRTKMHRLHKKFSGDVLVGQRLEVCKAQAEHTY